MNLTLRDLSSIINSIDFTPIIHYLDSNATHHYDCLIKDVHRSQNSNIKF